MRKSLRSWLWRVPLDQEIDEELAFHVEMRTRELVARGMDPAAARDEAIGRLGDRARLRRACMGIGRKREREMRLTQWIDELRDDVRFATRQVIKAPGFALVAILTLALGIGATTAIFSVVHAVVLRPLPYPDSDRVMLVGEDFRGQPASVSIGNFVDWQTHQPPSATSAPCSSSASISPWATLPSA